MERSVCTASANQRLLYLALVMGFVFFARHHYFIHSQSNWLIWAALMAALIISGDSFKQRVEIIFLTGATAAISAGIAACLSVWTIPLALYLLMVICFCMYRGQLETRYALPAILVGLLTLLSGMMPAYRFEDSVDRMVFIFGGFSLAALLQVVLWPRFVETEMNFMLAASIRDLRKVSQDMFDCFLQADFSQSMYLYERRLHLQKNKFMHSMSRAREMYALLLEAKTKMNLNETDVVLSKLDEIFTLLLACSQLRYRVSDYTIFAVCQKEMSGVARALDQALEHVKTKMTGKKVKYNLTELGKAISNFDNTFQTVLQVTAREPLDFLLFTANLNALHAEMVKLYEITVPNPTRH